MGFKPLEKTTRKHKRGLWSPEEDQRLRDYILQHGISCWSSVPANAGLQRNGKSCRLRWINYLRPGLKRGMFSCQEEEMILTLHKNLGNKWSQIAKQLPGRTDNEIKNYWHSYLKKKAPIPEEYKMNTEPEQNDSSFNQTTSRLVSGFDHESITSIEGMSSFEQNLNHTLLPRFLFSDWLTTDNSIVLNEPSDYQTCSKEGLDSKMSEKQDEDFLQCFQYNEGASTCVIEKFCQGKIEDDLQSNNMMDLSFTFLDQNTVGSCFMGLSAGNVVYSGF